MGTFLPLGRHAAGSWAVARGQPGKTMGHAHAVQGGHTGAVPLGRERIRPIGLRIVFLFSEWIQNLAKLKNLCTFGSKSEKCEINFIW
jgi:hypothetical protein